MDLEEAIRALPTCDVCGTPRATEHCLLCRAHASEKRLAALGAFEGHADEWMARVAHLREEAFEAKDRLMPIGFEGPVTKNPHNHSARPQVVCKPVMLTVDPVCAPWGTLLDIKVGNRSQIIDVTGLPLNVFNPQSWVTPEIMASAIGKLSCDTVCIAQDITLCVEFDLPASGMLAEEAYIAAGRELPSKFRAILWCKVEDPLEAPMTLPSIGAAPPMPMPLMMFSSSNAFIENTADKIADDLAVQAIRGTPAFRRLVKDILRRARRSG